MTVEPSPDRPAPSSPALPELAPGEIEFLRLAGVSLRRLSTVQSLVRNHFFDAVHEMRQRIAAAPPEPVDILVTSHRIVLGGTTYVPANITSVTYYDEVKRLGCAYASLGCGGLIFLVAICPLTVAIQNLLSGPVDPFGLMGPSSDPPSSGLSLGIVIGLVLIGIGIAIYKAATDQFSVTIATSGGGMDGFISRDRQTIQALHGAIQRSVTVGE